MTISPRTLVAALALALAPLAAVAGEGALRVVDAYARVSSPVAKSGAVFLVVENGGDRDDRIVAVRTDAAERAELHTHLGDANGVMRMVEVEDGFAVPAGGRAELRRGGDHVMLMGLTDPLEQGDTFPLTLVLESGDTLTVEVPVDLERRPEAHHGH